MLGVATPWRRDPAKKPTGCSDPERQSLPVPDRDCFDVWLCDDAIWLNAALTCIVCVSLLVVFLWGLWYALGG